MNEEELKKDFYNWFKTIDYYNPDFEAGALLSWLDCYKFYRTTEEININSDNYKFGFEEGLKRKKAIKLIEKITKKLNFINR